MILDKNAELTTATAYDLGTVRPGPGNPIKMFASGMAADALVTVTTGATDTAADACTTATVGANGTVEFELPSTTGQFIMATFAAGAINVILPGAQTNT